MKNQGDFFISERRITMWILMAMINLILVIAIIYQSKELRDLERKTLEAFKIVCKKIKPRKDDKKWN